ncbi:MAG: TetR/AcrR family transcriptional regulator [Thermoleophilaceae bacterium]|jgi:AcrR family transcriptional regulator|nr:TetR/AcrR family transcriptional regulator [Solirubrobacterales bacterium]MBJ7354344.1 TetR/AcrR family transcriptional regulator [Thermoleophilaceae bacterium]
MAIPPSPGAEAPHADLWTQLNRDQKRERTLAVADELFAREGIDVAMPVLAKAIGIGVGSLYRQFATKDELIAELVLQRVLAFSDSWEAAARRPDAWPALRGATTDSLMRSAADYITAEMYALKQNNLRIAAASAPILESIEKLLRRAQEQGDVREDATVDDIRLIFRGAKEAETLEPGGALRLAELILDGLAARH